MKKIIILLLALLVASPVLFAQFKAGKKDATQHAVLNTCPVHSEAINYTPGKCRFCGMDLNLSQKQEQRAEIAKTNTCPINGGITTNIAGRILNLSQKEKMKIEIVKLNTYPANANITGNKMVPNCGMDMIAKKTK